MPPAEVAIETRKVKEELRRFCQQPDKISHSITLLNNTKPLLQTIKAKIGTANTFYMSLSTQVVGNALYNLIEEVNTAQNYFSAVVKVIKESGIDPKLLNYLDDEHSPTKIIDSKVKPVLREAWKATTIMDGFDMETDFRTKRYIPNRSSLKEMCETLHISTSSSSYQSSSRASTTTTRTTTPPRTTPPSSSTSSSDDELPVGCWVVIIIAIIIFLANVLG